MPTNKKQLKRLVMLVAELKENRYPNSITFSDRMRKLDLERNLNLACTAKTIQRDILTLREEFGAPIAYCNQNSGYYLTHHGWDFQCPVLEEREMITGILGARLAEQIFPSPIKDDVRHATDRLLTGNNPDFLDTAMIQSLIVASGLKVPIQAAVFKVVFDGWQLRQAIRVGYRSVAGTVTDRTIEPHALVFQDSAWFIKAHCLLRDELRTFAVHRIQRAELLDKHFEPDPELLRQVRDGMLFDYTRASNIRIRCQATLLPYVSEKSLHSGQKIERHPDGTFTLAIPSAIEHDVVAWVLAQAGAATLLAPRSLRTLLVKISGEIHRNHRDDKGMTA